jgi:hypothetical protein
MIELIISTIASLFLALLGIYTGALKKLIGTIIKGIVKILKLQPKTRNKINKPTEALRSLYPELKKVEISKENTKIINSISYIGLSLITIAVVGLILNMTIINDQAISQWLSSRLNFVIPTVTVYYTSAMFALLTSGISVCVGQWKKGREFRKAQGRKHLIEVAKRELTEAELIEIIESKIEEKK